MRRIARRSAAFAGVCLLGLLGAPVAGEACSSAPCTDNRMVPFLESGVRSFPGNVPGVGIFSSAGAALTASTVSLRRVDVPGEVPITVIDDSRRWALYTVRLGAELVPGGEYELSYARGCTFNTPAPTPGMEPTPVLTRFTAQAPAPRPTRLGTLRLGALVRGEAAVPPSTAACSTAATVARREVSLDLDPSAVPFQGSLAVQLYVDEVPVGPSMVQGQLLTSLSPAFGLRGVPYTVCSGPSEAVSRGLSPGEHRFSYRARLLGSDVDLFTDSVTASLTCSDEPEGGLQCSTTPGRPAPRALPIAVAGLVALGALRRRARPRP